MVEIVVPATPPLARVHSIELMHAGQWDASSGTHEFTADDLAAAVAALACPAVRNPVLKFGHDGQHGKGDPAIGWVDNLATTDDGRTLIGDFAGMPGWLATTGGDGVSVLVAAYPDRSIEGTSQFRCQIGHVHDFVVEAVALLGLDRPAIGTLPSLQSLAELYGVQLSAPPGTAGTPVTIHLTAGGPVLEPAPTPRAVQVAAGVTTEDVRRAFYDGPGSSWSLWIEEFHLEPMQLIVTDDNTGKRTRIPVIVGDGDGAEAVSFGDPVTVVIRYEDAPAGQAAASSAANLPAVRFASRAESRSVAATSSEPREVPAPVAPAVPVTPEPAPQAPVTPEPPARPGSIPPPKEEDGMADLKTGLRQRLGLQEDVSDDDYLAAVDEALGERAEPTAASAGGITPPAGYLLVPTAAWEQAQTAMAVGVKAQTDNVVSERERIIADARDKGRILPHAASLKSWREQYDRDPAGTTAYLAKAPQIVPVAALGYSGGPESEQEQAERAMYAAMARDLGVSVEELTRG